jgi:hypothetical protein
MPRQDQYGRWISDDGGYWWDGQVWRPTRPPTTVPRPSSAPYYVGVGCAVVLLVFVLMGICASYVASLPGVAQ